jgi:hypothetical protein
MDILPGKMMIFRLDLYLKSGSWVIFPYSFANFRAVSRGVLKLTRSPVACYEQVNRHGKKVGMM